MNATITMKLAAYALGAVVGGITGYFAGRLIVDKIREMEEQAELDRKVEAVLSKLEPEDFEPRIAEERARNNGRNHKDYNKFSAQDKADLNSLAAPYRSSIGQQSEPETKNAPYVISFDQYEEEHFDYEKIRINYFEKDSVYAHTEPTESKVINVEQKIGNAHLHFGEDCDDPDVVYIRYDKGKTDYEITRINGSYAEVVIGETGNGGETKQKKKRKKVVKNDKDELREQQEDDGEFDQES